MTVQLTHAFLWRCNKDRSILLDGCDNFNSFCSRMEKQAKARFPKPKKETPEEEKSRVDDINKYKGDAFELFVEAMIRLFPCDRRLLLIEDYKVVTGQDVGVDGHGISGHNHKPFTVQCKYRQYDYVLTSKDLATFPTGSLLLYGVDQNPDPVTQKCNMVVITSAASLHHFTDNEMFGNMIYTFCRPQIKMLVDDNPTFWKYFSESWKDSFEKIKSATA